MRVIHTSDLHLGKILHERSLLDDQRHILAQITALVQRDPHDVIVIAGDVFDRSYPPESAVALFSGWLNDLRLAAPTTPIVIIAGNHDSGVRLAWGSELLTSANVYIRGSASSIDAPIRVATKSGERAEIWAVPFLWPTTEHPSQVVAFDHAIETITAARTSGQIQLLVAHCYASGSQASDSERTLIGQATMIDPAQFDAFDYVALGHLHRPQSVGLKARYSGSPLGYSFSEAAHPKCVLSVDVHAGALPIVREHPLVPLRRIRRVQGTIDALLHDPHYAEFEPDYLEVTLTDDSLISPMNRLRQRFPNLLQLRTPEADAPDQQVPASDQSRQAKDLNDDLHDFYRHISDAPPPEPVQAAFDALRLAVERGA